MSVIMQLHLVCILLFVKLTLKVCVHVLWIKILWCSVVVTEVAVVVPAAGVGENISAAVNIVATEVGRSRGVS